MGSAAAHHADIAFDPIPGDRTPVEDPVVGLYAPGIHGVKTCFVSIEAVCVLHHEFAGPEDSGSRPGFVPFLELDLVEQLREIPVGADFSGNVCRYRLLMRHRQDHFRTLSVLKTEELFYSDPSGLLPWTGRLHHRHRHLLAADPIHLFPDDRLDLPVDAPSGGKVGPQAGTQLANHSGSDQELVAGRFSVGRSVLDGRDECCRETGHRCGIYPLGTLEPIVLKSE